MNGFNASPTGWTVRINRDDRTTTPQLRTYPVEVPPFAADLMQHGSVATSVMVAGGEVRVLTLTEAGLRFDSQSEALNWLDYHEAAAPLRAAVDAGRIVVSAMVTGSFVGPWYLHVTDATPKVVG